MAGNSAFPQFHTLPNREKFASYWPDYQHGRKGNSMNARLAYAMIHGQRITPLDAYQMGCMRLSARIYDLRTYYSFPVKTEIIERRGKRFASYFLEAE